MTGHLNEPVTLRWPVPWTFSDWIAVLDALEPGASDTHREDAQDVMQKHAPRGWLDAAEAREELR